MADARREPSLVDEHRHEAEVRHELRQHSLDGDRAREPDRPQEPTEVDGGHAARGNLVVKSVPAGHQRAVADHLTIEPHMRLYRIRKARLASRPDSNAA